MEEGIEILYVLPGMWFFACILVDFDVEGMHNVKEDSSNWF